MSLDWTGLGGVRADAQLNTGHSEATSARDLQEPFQVRVSPSGTPSEEQ